MSRNLKILILLALCFTSLGVFAQQNREWPVLFTDRDFCISGDTLWFKVWMPAEISNTENVVHIQLTTSSDRLINVVMKKPEDGWAEGYLYVPDSLSTGVCFVTAFLNAQSDKPELVLESKALLVYNRFHEQVDELNLFENKSVMIDDKKSIFKISTDKKTYHAGEEVRVHFDAEEASHISYAVVRAALYDPLSSETGDSYTTNFKFSGTTVPGFVENDGILLNGQVVDETGRGQAGKLVILSITSEPPYFDYYYTNETGNFHFYLKNAVGKAKVVLQVITDDEKEYRIRVDDNRLRLKDPVVLRNKLLNPKQSDFIKTIVNSDYLRRLFNPMVPSIDDFFEMPPKFPIPFYGVPTKRVVPEEFFDLPDFQEISRELLPGVQYRLDNGQIVIRMINMEQNDFFKDEPLVLLNGIPVFNNQLIAGLKSTDISYIDMVQNERIYGDLKLDGILAVSLNDKSNNWMAMQKGVFQFTVNCLQPQKYPDYSPKNKMNINYPDMRRTYFWKTFYKPGDFNFKLSDLKGEIEIIVEGFSEGRGFFKTSKIIEVR